MSQRPPPGRETASGSNVIPPLFCLKTSDAKTTTKSGDFARINNQRSLQLVRPVEIAQRSVSPAMPVRRLASAPQPRSSKSLRTLNGVQEELSSGRYDMSSSEMETIAMDAMQEMDATLDAGPLASLASPASPYADHKARTPHSVPLQAPASIVDKDEDPDNGTGIG